MPRILLIDKEKSAIAMGWCPHCRGTKGFTYYIRVGMQGLWGSPAQTNDESYGSTTVICDDCGKRVNRELAEGRREK